MYRILPYTARSSALILPHTSSLAKQVKDGGSLLLEYGKRSQIVRVSLSASLAENHLGLSENIIQELNIPLAALYLIKESPDRLVIGPSIGILAELTDMELEGLLPTLSSYMAKYKKIGGSFLAFSLEGIQPKKQEIRGYMYQPFSKTWVKGIYAYPASLFSITEPSMTDKWPDFQRKMNHLQQVLGPAIYNYPLFSKWDMYHMLGRRFGEYLPETVLLEGLSEVRRMLGQYGSIYIKPINGRLGRSILFVSKTSGGFRLRYTSKRKIKSITFKEFSSLESRLKKLVLPGQYLIQERAPLMKHDRSVIDFRVIMVKDHVGKWQNSGIFARYGAKGSIVSNITAGGRAESARITLKKIWGLNEAEIEVVLNQMKALCCSVLEEVENNGYHCGNIGIDLGLTKDLDLVLIEMNNQNPDPYIAKAARRNADFLKTRYLNMQYAKKLAGF